MEKELQIKLDSEQLISMLSMIFRANESNFHYSVTATERTQRSVERARQIVAETDRTNPENVTQTTFTSEHLNGG